MAIRSPGRIVQSSLRCFKYGTEPFLRSSSSNAEISTVPLAGAPWATRPMKGLWGSQVSINNRQPSSCRHFSSSRPKQAKNRIYTSVRRPDELQSYILSSTSSRTPLITLWTASYCSSCKTIAPLINSLIASGIGESSTSSVNYCEVEFDSQDIMTSGLGMEYMITSLPTLMSFDRGEVMTDTKVVDLTKMKDEKWLREWIEGEAQRKGQGSGGGAMGGGYFGGLFGNTKP